MIVRATQKYVRITPRKLRDVANVIRGRQLFEVNELLSNLNKRGARVLNETIRQAVANAVNNQGLREQDLELKTVMINEGPRFKRFRAGSRGRAKGYIKRTAHVVVELGVKNAAVASQSIAPEAKKDAVKTTPTVKSAKSTTDKDPKTTTDQTTALKAKRASTAKPKSAKTAAAPKATSAAKAAKAPRATKKEKKAE